MKTLTQLCLLLFFIHVSAVNAAIYTVNTTSDITVADANLTLREAIAAANASAGKDTIHFNIAGAAPFTITLTAFLNITDSLFIDGTTQAGYNSASPTPVIVLTGSPLHGIVLTNTAKASHIKALAINNCSGRGIVIQSAKNKIEGCFIGTNHLGTVAAANAGAGIAIEPGFDNDSNVIGGITTAQRNIISGNNDHAIIIEQSNYNIVCGNYIGPDITGMNDITTSGAFGVNITNNSTNNRIGGSSVDSANVISGNGSVGVGITNSSNNVVAANIIGLGSDGLKALGNGGNGIELTNSPFNQIGLPLAGAGNIVSSNAATGINLDVNSKRNTIHANIIGLAKNGTTVRGNTSHGIFIGNGSDTVEVGGSSALARNIISGNNVHGIDVLSCTGTKIKGNYIGTTSAGNADVGNAIFGIQVQDSPETIIGGNKATEGNVISGNNVFGILLEDGFAPSPRSVIKGNIIGSDPTETIAIGNGNIGMLIKSDYCTIGGTINNEGNVVVANNGIGIFMPNSSYCIIEGNYIGLTTNLTPMANQGDGLAIVFENKNAFHNKILYNIIAYNNGHGVNIGDAPGGQIGNDEFNNKIRFNEIFCNTNQGIFINSAASNDWGNNGKNTPRINYTLSTSGNIIGVTDPTLAGDTIDIYLVTDCINCDVNPQGRSWVGYTEVDGSGNWSYTNASLSGIVTVTATNNNGTSEFSKCCQATKGNSLTKEMKYTCAADTVIINYSGGLAGDSLMLQRSYDLTSWSNVYAIELIDPAEFKDVISDTAYYRIITFSNGAFDVAECKDTSDVIRAEPDRIVVAGSLEVVGSTTLCPGTKSTLNVVGSNGDLIKWYVFPAGGTFTETGITGPTIEVSHEVNSPLIRSYLAESIIGECKAMTGFQVFSNFNVVPGDINGPSEICNDQTITLTLENYVGDIQWQRNNGTTWEDIPGETNNSVTYNPALAKTTVQFRAVLADTIAAACTAMTDPHSVTSDTCTYAPEVNIPNALTPNGDLINDVFYIDKILDYPNNHLIIYNRWGNKVFETTGYKNEWKGVDEQGEPLPVATYYYVLELGPDTYGNMNELNSYSGSVSILR